MATQLNNFANLRYNNGETTESVLTNTTTTNLLDAYGLLARKVSHNNNWRPAENITYTIQIENSGTEPIYAISIQDDLGKGTPTLLTYVDNSLIMNRAGVLTNETPTSTSPLTMTLNTPLALGEIVTFTYVAKVRSDIDPGLTEITNTVTVAGHEVSVSGPVVTADPVLLTLPKASYAEVRVNKSVNKAEIANGEDLTYTFELVNSGNIDAVDVTIIDTLPTGFTINTITANTNGVTTSFDPADYSVDGDNKLVLPTSAIKKITVPAATLTGNGTTIVTIVGTVNI